MTGGRTTGYFTPDVGTLHMEDAAGKFAAHAHRSGGDAHFIATRHGGIVQASGERATSPAGRPLCGTLSRNRRGPRSTELSDAASTSRRSPARRTPQLRLGGLACGAAGTPRGLFIFLIAFLGARRSPRLRSAAQRGERQPGSRATRTSRRRRSRSTRRRSASMCVAEFDVPESACSPTAVGGQLDVGGAPHRRRDRRDDALAASPEAHVKKARATARGRRRRRGSACARPRSAVVVPRAAAARCDGTSAGRPGAPAEGHRDAEKEERRVGGGDDEVEPHRVRHRGRQREERAVRPEEAVGDGDQRDDREGPHHRPECRAPVEDARDTTLRRGDLRDAGRRPSSSGDGSRHATSASSDGRRSGSRRTGSAPRNPIATYVAALAALRGDQPPPRLDWLARPRARSPRSAAGPASTSPIA